MNAGEQTAYDVVVVGSGAGAMMTACRAHDNGLSVVIIEKTDFYGGTSAVSGGAVWIPNNHHIREDGGNDSPDDALAYLKAATRGQVPETRINAYIDQAPRMLRYAEEKTRVRYQANPYYADYYQDLPGAKVGFRALDVQYFDGRELGGELLRMRETSPTMLIFGHTSMTTPEAIVLLSRSPGWRALAAKILLKYWLDLPWRLRSARDRRLNMGNALVGGLRRSIMDREIPLWLNTALQTLMVESGRVTGVCALRAGREVRIAARKAVVLAAGGFERNQQMRNQYLPKPSKAEWTATPPCNTGDAIRAAQSVGAAVELMQHAWWTPTVRVPGEEKQRGLFSERALPGCIVVNRLGKRFANEAQDYLDFVLAMYADHGETAANLPAWMIFDKRFRCKYNVGPLMSGSVRPDWLQPRGWLGKVYFRAQTLQGLAAQIGVDGASLSDSVLKFNGYAASGVDPEFNRGANKYDVFYGDPGNKPNPCLGPLTEPPYYALPLDAGEIGTKGGLATDEHARVLTIAGDPIPGLYAVGNTSASVTGPSYPGAGATLGPAMTFGFVAANHIAGVS